MRQIANSSVSINFLCATSNVRQIKRANGEVEPKLELTAALLAARIKRFLVETLKLVIADVYLWSDSTLT